MRQIAINLLIFFTFSMALAQENLHEPYWQYDQNGLRDYAKRILQTVSSYIIDESQVNKTDKIFINDLGKLILVRQVHEFGRVLPNIYLRQMLKKLHDQKRAVSKIFLLPKKDTNIKFTFLLPHKDMQCDSGNNCIQVLSDSFEIFQEYILGDGQAGDTSFANLGHTDFNAKQIIKNPLDNLNYLIDTKEKKNFFLPAFYPYSEALFGFALFKSGRSIPLDSHAFSKWQRRTQSSMVREAQVHFGQASSAVIDLGPMHQIDLSKTSNIDYSDALFDDGEDEPYYTDPRDNLVRYLFLGRFDLANKLLEQKIPLSNLSIPSESGPLSPVQFILKSDKLSTIGKFHLLSTFSKEKQYFATDPSVQDASLSPLYRALAIGDKAIFLLVAENGADINAKVGYNNILDESYRRLMSLTGQEKEDGLLLVDYIRKRSNLKTLTETLHGFLFYGWAKELDQEERIGYIKEVIAQLPYFDDSLIKDIFTSRQRDLIEGILTRNFDYQAMLKSAMALVRSADPESVKYRKLLGDTSPVDYYWYGLVKKILNKRSSATDDQAIDLVFANNLFSLKTTILCEMLKYLPVKMPQTMKQIERAKSSELDSTVLLRSAIESRCPTLLEFLAKHGLKIDITHVQDALTAPAQVATKLTAALAVGTNIDLSQALNVAIAHNNEDAAIRFLRALHDRSERPTKDNYQKIFESGFLNLKATAVSQAANSSKAELLGSLEMDKIIHQGVKTIDYLVDHDIALGYLLVGVVHHMMFDKDKIANIGPWFDLLDKLDAKDISAPAVASVLVSALQSAESKILSHLPKQLKKILPQPEGERIKATIRANIRSKYMSDSHFRTALTIGNLDLVKLYLEEGAAVLPEHLDLARFSINPAKTRVILQKYLKP